MARPTRLRVETGTRVLTVEAVMLYPEFEYETVVAARTEAQEQLGGFSSGIGFIGSPGSVLMGVTALGVVESLISSRTVKKGIAALRRSTELHRLLRGSGMFFEISQIDEIHHPDPSRWAASADSPLRLDLNTMGFFERGGRMMEFGVKRQQIGPDGIAVVPGPRPFVHDGDDFVWLKVDNSPIAVRWSQVSSFAVT